jgi:hypothetical protein
MARPRKKKKPGRKPIKKSIKTKVTNLSIAGKTDKQIRAIVPSISQSSISKIKKSNRELIAEGKRKYIKLIDKSTGGDKTQAEVLSQALTADTEIFNFRGEVVGHRADHKTRLDAVKYIDKLKGREDKPIHQTQNNTFIARELDKYIK